jgi:hypothetical protein
MRFGQGPFRGSSSPHIRTPVFAIGRRVRVACPVNSARRVTLTDDLGTNMVGTLSDGSEVEILAWRPLGGGTRYQVRATRNNLEGWLAVGDLCATQAVTSSTPKAPPIPSATRPALQRAPVSPKPRRGKL